MTKDKLLNLRVSQSLIDDLQETAKRLDVPYSQIIRDAVREKLDELNLKKKGESAKFSV